MRVIRRRQRGTELYDLIKIQESYSFLSELSEVPHRVPTRRKPFIYRGIAVL